MLVSLALEEIYVILIGKSTGLTDGEEMVIKAIVSSKGQIVIPKLMRETMGLHYGSELVINLREDNVLEFQQIKKNITNFFGMGKRMIKDSGTEEESKTDVDEAIASTIMKNNFS